MARVIDRVALQALLGSDADFVLVETLPSEHYANGHIPGAVNLPPAEIRRRRAAEVIPGPETEIILYCASSVCDAATKAERLLRALGYGNILHYLGGKADWKEAGLPLRSGSAA